MVIFFFVSPQASSVAAAVPTPAAGAANNNAAPPAAGGAAAGANNAGAAAGANNNTGAAAGANNNAGAAAGANNNAGAAAGANNNAGATPAAGAADPVNTVSSATANNPDLQNSLTLDPSVIAPGFLNDGQGTPAAGQVASLTSGNNFINFCATSNLPKTDGKQVAGGSCNAAPMGLIPSVDNMPSAKFTFPLNGGTVAANQPFTISVAVARFETGNFVNAQLNYFSAPQQLNAQGQIRGHSHVVVEELDSLTQTTPTDPRRFAFFKGLNAAAVNGVLTADVTNGLPAGVYKVSTINTASNHQPVLLPVAQHGSPEDVVYVSIARLPLAFNSASSNISSSP